jgi:adenosylcobinamide amidohydrolase
MGADGTVAHPMDVTEELRDEDGTQWPVLVWRFGAPLLTCSTGPHGGGLGLRRWAINAQVPRTYAEPDPAAHCAAIAERLGLDGDGVGLLTAADVGRATRAADDGVTVVTTVGLGQPEWAAGDGDDGSASGSQSSAPSDEEGAGMAVARSLGRFAGRAAAKVRREGTINVFAWVPEPLSEAALVNAVGTITEAKVQALFDAGVAATGTATDAVVVACPIGGQPQPYGGPRSQLGAPLARAAHAAILAGARERNSRQ